MVLLALIRLGEDAYGVPISQAIDESTGRDVLVGSVYAAGTAGRRPGRGGEGAETKGEGR